MMLDWCSGLPRGLIGSFWRGLCTALSGWLRWQVPSGQVALPVVRVMAPWGFKILGFRVWLRYSGKKTGKYWECRRHKKLSDEASGDTENWKFALSKSDLLRCCTFYLTEFCDHLISWCSSRHQGGESVITEFILENTMLFWNEYILRVSTVTVGSSINAKQVFVNSHSCFLVTLLWIKAFKEIWSKGWNIF